MISTYIFWTSLIGLSILIPISHYWVFVQGPREREGKVEEVEK